MKQAWLAIKVCKDCLRVNKESQEKCYCCGSDHFDTDQLTPACDSIEAYLMAGKVVEQ